MIHQIAEMWNLNKPGTRRVCHFSCVSQLKSKITAKITIGPKQQLPNLQAQYSASRPLKRLLMIVMAQNPSAYFDQKSMESDCLVAYWVCFPGIKKTIHLKLISDGWFMQ